MPLGHAPSYLAYQVCWPAAPGCSRAAFEVPYARAISAQHKISKVVSVTCEGILTQPEAKSRNTNEWEA
eukprot:3295738-Pleurochrysis_carterae.AAC.3